ncbi:MAG: hypothetical protein IIZ67_02625 [Bacilli bacterium]|nr:hypothetical protein [Bacilli bacterium]
MAKGSRAYRRVQKGRKNVVVNKEYLKEYRRTQQKLNEVTKRLQALSKNGYSGTWASRKLLNRLQGGKVGDVIDVTKRGGQITGIKASRRLTKTEMVAIQKASSQFLVSKTSTKKGIEEVRQSTIESLKTTLSTDKKKLTNEEAEALYDMLGDNDFDDFAQKLGASTMWNIIEDAIGVDFTSDAFIKRLSRYIEIEDVNLREKARRIYEKYVL